MVKGTLEPATVDSRDRGSWKRERESKMASDRTKFIRKDRRGRELCGVTSPSRSAADASFGDTNEITKRQYKGILGKINPIDTVCPFLEVKETGMERETNRKTMINGEMAADVKILPSFENGAWEDCRKYGAGLLH